MRRLACILVVASLCHAAHGAAQEHVAVAASANLVYALDSLDAAFAAANPGIAVTTSVGASGSLVAEIENGAPCDVFLSADMDFPRRLIEAGGADASTLTPFAVGRLVLWTVNPRLPFDSVEAALLGASCRRIAIANPRTAPYGRAAEEVLGKLGLSGRVRAKIVTGESVSQAAQFVETGNADAGFVALSLVLSPRLRDRGLWIEVPAALHEPIVQGAVLTHRGAANPAARRYLQFLKSRAALEVLARFGYEPVP